MRNLLCRSQFLQGRWQTPPVLIARVIPHLPEDHQLPRIRGCKPSESLGRHTSMTELSGGWVRLLNPRWATLTFSLHSRDKCFTFIFTPNPYSFCRGFKDGRGSLMQLRYGWRDRYGRDYCELTKVSFSFFWCIGCFFLLCIFTHVHVFGMLWSGETVEREEAQVLMDVSEVNPLALALPW